MSTLMTIVVVVGVYVIFIGVNALADVVYNRSQTYCNEPECKRFLIDKEKLSDHDREHHSEKWPDGRPLLDFTRAYLVKGRARWKWSVRHLVWTAVVLAAGLYTVKLATRFFV